METLGVQSDLITRMSNIYWILPYYDYAYESVKVLRGLCHKTRTIWINNQNIIIKMLHKQTIDFGHCLNEKIEALKKGDKYKLFKLNISIDLSGDAKTFFKILDEIPELEIAMIDASYDSDTYNDDSDWNDDFDVTNGFYKECIDTLVKRLILKNKQELIKVLNIDGDPPELSEPYEYLKEVYFPYLLDMSRYVKHTG